MKKEYATLRKKLETYFQVSEDTVWNLGSCLLSLGVWWSKGFFFLFVQMARQAGPKETAFRPK